MGRHAAVLAFVCVAAAAMLVAAAIAAPPVHFTDSVDYSGSVSCGSFNDLYQGHLDIQGITKFDRNGNPVEDVVHITGWERNWRSDRPAVTMTAKRSFTILYDYASNSENEVGNIITQTAPGLGVLFHDVGNISFDDATGNVITIHGPHDVFEQGDAAFCNALIAIS